MLWSIEHLILKIDYFFKFYFVQYLSFHGHPFSHRKSTTTKVKTLSTLCCPPAAQPVNSDQQPLQRTPQSKCGDSRKKITFTFFYPKNLSKGLKRSFPSPRGRRKHTTVEKVLLKIYLNIIYVTPFVVDVVFISSWLPRGHVRCLPVSGAMRRPPHRMASSPKMLNVEGVGGEGWIYVSLVAFKDLEVYPLVMRLFAEDSLYVVYPRFMD